MRIPQPAEANAMSKEDEVPMPAGPDGAAHKDLKSQRCKPRRRYQHWLWPAMFASSVLVTVLLVAYDARLFERFAAKWESPAAGFFDGQFDDKSFNGILNQTVANLNDHKPVLRAGDGYCRIEKWIREHLKKQLLPLDLSHAMLAIGIATSIPGTNSSTFETLEKYCALNFDGSGNLAEYPEGLDSFAAGSVLLDMFEQTGRDSYRVAARKMARYLTDRYPKNELGAMPYWADKPNLLLMDDKGTVCGFLIRYGIKFKDAEALNLGVRQLRTFLQHGMNETDGLPFHAYDLTLDRKFGPATWCRGIGWMAMGLADALENLPKDHEAYLEFADALTRMLQTLRKYQEPDGCWHWDVNNPTAQLDTSGTAMIGCAVERAIRAGAIDDSWGTMSENALRGILRHTHRNGLVDQAMAQCGGVGDYPCIFGPSNYAQGPTLALFSLVRQRFSAKQGRRQACISIIRRSGNASTVLQTLNN